MNSRSVDVLVIDDDELTAEIVERALRKVAAPFRVVAAYDGQEGLELLRADSDCEVRRPYLILLDLNMPRMNGFEFLREMRDDPRLRDSVVFVLTSSDDDSDRSRAYQEMIAGYMVKSAVGPQFVKLASLLQQYGSTIVMPQ